MTRLLVAKRTGPDKESPWYGFQSDGKDVQSIDGFSRNRREGYRNDELLNPQ